MVSISSVAANQTGMNSKILTGRVINQKEHFANWDLAAYVLNVWHVPQNDTEKLLFIYIALSDLNKEFVLEHSASQMCGYPYASNMQEYKKT